MLMMNLSVRCLSVFVASMLLAPHAFCVDAVTVDATGNTLFTGNVTTNGAIIGNSTIAAKTSISTDGNVAAKGTVSSDSNITSKGPITAIGQIGAPNVLQGTNLVAISAATTLSDTSFGSWHLIQGTGADYSILLPSAIGNAGKTIGLRVKHASLAPKTYTVLTQSGQTIDGDYQIAMTAKTTLIVMSDGSGWTQIGGTSFYGTIAARGNITTEGSITSKGNITANGQIIAPNILQGTNIINITSATNLPETSFGCWHLIQGVSGNYTITLPTAINHAGQTIGFRVRDPTLATYSYRIESQKPQFNTISQFIDGNSSVTMTANTTLVLTSDGNGWTQTGGTSFSGSPTGTIIAFGGTTPPPGWLECNGQIIARTDYKGLFSVIGTNWGNGDGLSTFGVPDLRRRVPMGSGGTGSPVIGNAVGNQGGEEVHTLTVNEMPTHQHLMFSDEGEGGVVITPASISAKFTGTTGFTDYKFTVMEGYKEPTLGRTRAMGGSASHNVIQPSAVVMYLIKY